MRSTELFSPDRSKELGFYGIDSKKLAWKSMDGAEPAGDECCVRHIDGMLGRGIVIPHQQPPR